MPGVRPAGQGGATKKLRVIRVRQDDQDVLRGFPIFGFFHCGVLSLMGCRVGDCHGRWAWAERYGSPPPSGRGPRPDFLCFGLCDFLKPGWLEPGCPAGRGVRGSGLGRDRKDLPGAEHLIFRSGILRPHPLPVAAPDAYRRCRRRLRAHRRAPGLFCAALQTRPRAGDLHAPLRRARRYPARPATVCFERVDIPHLAFALGVTTRLFRLGRFLRASTYCSYS